MWFADLSPCTYFPVDAKLVAVGWLERGKTQQRASWLSRLRNGSSGAKPAKGDRRVYEALSEMLKDPWQPIMCCGPHQCDLCQFEGPRGSDNLFIPGDGVIYVCPELIVHYMNAHGYVPPAVFCRAVLACPPMHTMPYRKAIVACGGGKLVSAP